MDLQQRYAEAMLRHPGLAGFGFATLAGVRTHHEGEAAEAELIEMARRALKTMDTSCFIDFGYHLQGELSQWNSGSRIPDTRIRCPGPFEFLTRVLGNRASSTQDQRS